MSLECAFPWEGRDQTELLNAKLAKLFTKGIYYGGELSPLAGTLTCLRTPLCAVSCDGMTVRDLQSGVFTYGAGLTNYHVITAKYNPLGTPATPTLTEEVLTEAAYLASPDIAYMIVVARVVLAGGATEVTTADIKYDLRDDVGPYGHSYFRGIVDDSGDLPTPTPSHNKEGDFYFVVADWSFYIWSGSVWTQVRAAGAATLDGAYDDGGAGAGRTITADSGAVEIVQPTSGSRIEDLGNAAFRIRKVGSAIIGSVGEDVVQDCYTSIGAYTARDNVASGANVQVTETVDITAGAGGPLTFTRVGCNLNAVTYGGTGKLLQLVEIVSATNPGNIGLFAFNVIGATSGTVKNLDGTTPTMTAETGVTVRLYMIRSCIGSQYMNQWTAWTLGTPSSYEFIGPAFFIGTGGKGKVYAYLAGNVDSVQEWWRLTTGSMTRVALISSDGCLAVAPATGVNSAITADARNTTGAGIRGICSNDDQIAGVQGSSFGFENPGTGELGRNVWGHINICNGHASYYSGSPTWVYLPATGTSDDGSWVGVSTDGIAALQIRWDDFTEGMILQKIVVDCTVGSPTNAVGYEVVRIRYATAPTAPPAVPTITRTLMNSGTLSADASRKTYTLLDATGYELYHANSLLKPFSCYVRITFTQLAATGSSIFGLWFFAKQRSVNKFYGPQHPDAT